MHSASFETDPKHVGFVLRRYHFVARQLVGRGAVLEIGCGDCTGARIVKQTVGHLEGCDIDRPSGFDVIRHHKHDILSGPLLFGGGKWDAIYALDVLEHISPELENVALRHIAESLDDHGAVIVGMPSRESQPYASALSRLHHVNCKTEDELRETMSRHFWAVFTYGLNDYALHEGFGPMCHYRFAVCAGKR